MGTFYRSGLTPNAASAFRNLSTVRSAFRRMVEIRLEPDATIVRDLNEVGTGWGRSGDGLGTERGRSGDGVGTEWGRSGDGVGTERGRSGDGAGTGWGRGGDGGEDGSGSFATDSRRSL
jgi:hypothetical protein